MTSITAAGDAALLVDTATDAGLTGGPAGLAAAIRAAGLKGLIDVVPGARTVLVTFDPGCWSLAELADRLRRLAPRAGAKDDGGPVTEIAVVYDGPDLADVAALTGLTISEVIARHAAAAYQVGWLGFSPGFGYLTGLDPVLATVPRLDSPRLTVPAGSVAIAGGLTAVYPAASPGGWRLLGRTSASLWDPGRAKPALLSPGMKVRFRPVNELPSLAEQSAAPPAWPAGQRLVQVVQPGPLTTIQDLGRPGLAHLGVPGSGAADPASLRLANNLVGNPEGAACLELTLGRVALRFMTSATVALAGAAAPMRLGVPDEAAASNADRPAAGPNATEGDADDSDPGQPRPAGTREAAKTAADDDAVWRPTPGTAFSVPAGAILRIGPPVSGLRSYLAIGGGVDVPAVLGSRSADSLSGLGPAPLQPASWLPIGRPRSLPERGPGQQPRGGGPPPLMPAMAAGAVELRAIAGPRDDWFAAAALETLADSEYLVSAASNRSGLRLTGPPLRRQRPGELPSEGVATGSLQVTHDGQPILLLADHPTTGGYPVIAVIRSADIGLAAQLRPGQRVRFSIARPGRATGPTERLPG
ncbi:MAG: carboxyltransferase domain-containing protein [Streptosporangiaceae bacterium]